jgi:hypothetical protein
MTICDAILHLGDRRPAVVWYRRVRTYERTVPARRTRGNDAIETKGQSGVAGVTPDKRKPTLGMLDRYWHVGYGT